MGGGGGQIPPSYELGLNFTDLFFKTLETKVVMLFLWRFNKNLSHQQLDDMAKQVISER